MSEELKKRTKKHFVVGVGASAGGLEALNELFDHMPPDTGCSFVVVQHLSPDYKSMIASLLAKHTEMPVHEAKDGLLLMPNAVYVIPEKKSLLVENGKLKVADVNKNQVPNFAIDTFFKSLAEQYNEQAIAVILSGTGSDGSKGARAIKERKGKVLVQDPVSAAFSGMPENAINTGLADTIVAPEFIPESILGIVNSSPEKKSHLEKLTDQQMELISRILDVINKEVGINFTLYKKTTIFRRIIKRMKYLEMENLTEYYSLLCNSSDEVQVLYKEFLIGVTRFFRDKEAFNVIQNHVIPELLNTKSQDSTLKIWVPGCSTGQEAYSLAILVGEYLEKTGKLLDVKIFATDIDVNALEEAGKAYYPLSIEEEVSADRLAKYFIRENDQYRVVPFIRKMVIFARHNLVNDAPFSKIDLISCRNLLIYLEAPLQNKVLGMFNFALVSGGYLFLGPSENLSLIKGFGAHADNKWKIFKKTGSAKEPNLFLKDLNVIKPEIRLPYSAQRSKSDSKSDISTLFCETVSEEFDFGGVMVDEQFEVKQVVGNFKKYLSLPDKNLQLNLQKMVHEDLIITLGSLIRKVFKTKEKVIRRNIRLLKDDKSIFINITVKPVVDDASIVFVLFGEENRLEQIDKTEGIGYELTEDVKIKIKELESELADTKETLQTTIEELETANEELQSTVEELLSANEELQSTNEELQSLNEELHTVNTEHQFKIKELAELNDDLNNYFRSTDIGQVFINKEFVITKFTPAATRHINLIENDIGRPFNHITTNIRHNGLFEDIKYVLEKGYTVQTEVKSVEGRYYQLTIIPYLKNNKEKDGVVLTFVDITAGKKVNNLLAGILESPLTGILALKTMPSERGSIADFEILLLNSSASEIFQIENNEELIGKSLLESIPSFGSDGLFNKIKKVAETGKDLRIEYLYKANNCELWLAFAAVPIENGVAITINNITDKKLGEEKVSKAYNELKKAEMKLLKLNNELEERVKKRTAELTESEQRFKLVAKATKQAIWDWSLIKNEVWWNDGFKQVFGYDLKAIEPGIESWFNRVHADDKVRVVDGIYSAINDGLVNWSEEFRFLKHDGNYAHVFAQGYVLNNEYGIPHRMVGAMMDMTNLKKAQDELEKTNYFLNEVNNDLDNFIYTASHDLKAPISNIEGLVLSLQEELTQESEVVKYILELVKKSIERFKATISDLTEISKIQKNIENVKEEIDLAEVVEETKEMIKFMIDENQATIKLDYNPDIKIYYSRKNFNSIIYNLISNAIKYRHPDRFPMVEIGLKEESKYLQLTVKDNGLGISLEKKDRIFDMFKRFHDHVDGTGVGLYIVKRIIDNAGGSIEVESVPGEGTAFKVYIKKI